MIDHYQYIYILTTINHINHWIQPEWVLGLVLTQPAFLTCVDKNVDPKEGWFGNSQQLSLKNTPHLWPFYALLGHLMQLCRKKEVKSPVCSQETVLIPNTSGVVAKPRKG